MFYLIPTFSYGLIRTFCKEKEMWKFVLEWCGYILAFPDRFGLCCKSVSKSRIESKTLEPYLQLIFFAALEMYITDPLRAYTSLAFIEQIRFAILFFIPVITLFFAIKTSKISLISHFGLNFLSRFRLRPSLDPIAEKVC